MEEGNTTEIKVTDIAESSYRKTPVKTFTQRKKR